MPRKRNTSWSRNKKEKQILTARLIEISLKVDDHIYKHEPISECEAERYMREVSSYKVQCSRDERSLQVIEKLTRCMKAIILDHQELRGVIHGSSIADYNVISGEHQELRVNKSSEVYGSSIFSGTIRAGSISPVYSLPDEDKTQFTQVAEKRAITVTEADNDIEIINLSNMDDDDDLIRDKTNNKIVDFAGTRINVKVDIHRDTSSLSLKDVQDPLDITPSGGICSQSILNNFEGFEQLQHNKIDITSAGAVAGLVGNVADKEKTNNVMQAGGKTSVDKIISNIPIKKTVPIVEHSQTMELKTKNAPNKTIFFKKTDMLYKTVVLNNDHPNAINTTNYSLTNICNHNTISSPILYPVTNNFPENLRKTCYDSNKTCTINDSSHTLKDAHHFSHPAQIYKVVNPITVKNVPNLNVNIPTNAFHEVNNENKPINATETSKALLNNTAIGQENSTTNKKKRGPRKKKTDENEIKTETKKLYRAPKSNKENTFTNSAKNKSIPIYNENVINDLSWIENIRYVREIKVDENVPNLNLEDSFWDNYYLPANWSDNEFV